MSFNYEYNIEVSNYFIVVIKKGKAYRSRSLFIKQSKNTYMLISDSLFSMALKSGDFVQFQVREKNNEISWSKICSNTTIEHYNNLSKVILDMDYIQTEIINDIICLENDKLSLLIERQKGYDDVCFSSSVQQNVEYNYISIDNNNKNIIKKNIEYIYSLPMIEFKDF